MKKINKWSKVLKIENWHWKYTILQILKCLCQKLLLYHFSMAWPKSAIGKVTIFFILFVLRRSKSKVSCLLCAFSKTVSLFVWIIQFFHHFCFKFPHEACCILIVISYSTSLVVPETKVKYYSTNHHNHCKCLFYLQKFLLSKLNCLQCFLS